MFFWVRSRHDVQSTNPVFEKHIIVSINTTGDTAADVVKNDRTHGVLALHFDDLDQEPGPSFRRVYGRDVVLFDEEHAAKIHRFVVDRPEGVDCIVVHCDMGVSRSSAVGAAISRWLDGTDEGFFGYGKHPRRFSTKCLTPNMHVYRTLLTYLERQAKS